MKSSWVFFSISAIVTVLFIIAVVSSAPVSTIVLLGIAALMFALSTISETRADRK